MSVDSIHTGLLKDLPDSYQKTVGTPNWTMTRAMARGLASGEAAINDAYDTLDPANLTGSALDQYIRPRTGQSRKQATFAAGSVTVTGTGVITAGDLFETAGGIQFRAGESVKVNGMANALVSCVTPGTVGNVPAGAIVKMPVQIAGISMVFNPVPLVDGYDAESDKDFYARFLDRLQHPTTGSNKWQYAQWAKDVAGVGAVKVFPLGHGDHTVDIVLLDSDGQPASASIVDAVQAYIDPDSTGEGKGQASIGAQCYVSAAQALPLDITVTVKLLSGATEHDTTQAVKANMSTYLKSVAFAQDYVSYGKLAATINESTGVQDYADLTINGGVSNISVTERQAAILGEVVIIYA